MQYKLIQALSRVDYKDVATRAFWTFLQAFLAVFIIAGESIINLLFAGDWSGLMTLFLATALSGVAAGLSAIKTILLEVIRELKKA